MQAFPPPTVHSLRKRGFKIRVYHWRYINGELVSSAFHRSKLSPKGGKTEVTITYQDGQSFGGEAVCSLSDCFNRKLGVKIALGRALKLIGVNETGKTSL